MRASRRGFGRIQRDFAAALLDPSAPLPNGIVGPNRMPCVDRFNVYRNNVVVGLIDALKASYPAVCRIVGDEFFVFMARAYCMAQPPHSPIMLDYGRTYPTFIGSFGPANGLEYLRDVARLERAWVEAYHAAEAPPTDAAALWDVGADRLAQVRLRLHPSLRVVRSRFPVVQLWQMNVAAGVAAPIDICQGGEDALVVRPEADVEVRTMPPGAASFVQRLQARMTVLEAVTDALAECATFDVAETLSALVEMRAVTGWDLHTDRPFDLSAT